jgi:hypothetical protein
MARSGPGVIEIVAGVDPRLTPRPCTCVGVRERAGLCGHTGPSAAITTSLKRILRA